jgi:hypothetical protein
MAGDGLLGLKRFAMLLVRVETRQLKRAPRLRVRSVGRNGARAKQAPASIYTRSAARKPRPE